MPDLILLITCLVICVVGFFVTRYLGSQHMWWKARLTWLTLLILGTFGAGQGAYAITYNITQQNAVSGYHQFLNGTVVTAEVQTTPCSKDGSCQYTYQCDPYIVTSVEFYTDANGDMQSRTVTTTEYHSCPYVTEENEYFTKDSIGNTHSFGAYIAQNAVAWRQATAIPSTLPRGIPQPWQKARTALDAGYGIPMTAVGEYSNYILASDDKLLKASSNKIKILLKDKLLPQHTQNLTNPIHDAFDADKVSFVGFTPSDASHWQQAVMQFNAALGMTLRGDLHVVVIQDSLLPSGVSPEDYGNAIKAYWLNDLGKYAFAKNAIMVVLGVSDDHQTIDWAKATTGMPIGNGSMLRQLENSLTNTPFDLSKVMGETKASVSNGKATYTIGEGAIPQTIMVDFPFQRACMQCTSKGESSTSSFVNIPTDAHVDGWGYFLTILVVTIFSGIFWIIFGRRCYVAKDYNYRLHGSYDRYRYRS